MRRSFAALLALLAAAACQTSGALEDGDRLFRVERYHQALETYLAAAGDEESAGEALASRILETRYRILSSAALRSIHGSRPREAMRLLDGADSVVPGHPRTTELGLRARRDVAREYVEVGREHLEEDRPRDAAAAYAEALSWDPDSAAARAGLGSARARVDARQDQGERYYFLGLEELGAGYTVRARTAFAHATSYWGEDSRAGELFGQLSEDLARASRIEGVIYVEAQAWGPAWLALRDANRLHPGHEETQRLLARVENELRAADLLTEADMAIRAGDVERSRELLAKAEEVTSSHAGEISQLRVATVEEHLRQRYVLARACELDNQFVRSTALYEEILAESSGIGYEDVFARVQSTRERVAAARVAYEAALEAEAAGDTAAYLSHLAECVRQASDYGDAFERYRSSR